MRAHSVLKCQKVQRSDLVLKGLIRIKRVRWPYVLLVLIINTEIQKERAESSVSILIGQFLQRVFLVITLQQFKGNVHLTNTPSNGMLGVECKTVF